MQGRTGGGGSDGWCLNVRVRQCMAGRVYGAEGAPPLSAGQRLAAAAHTAEDPDVREAEAAQPARLAAAAQLAAPTVARGPRLQRPLNEG